jgi:hypothetical protein
VGSNVLARARALDMARYGPPLQVRPGHQPPRPGLGQSRPGRPGLRAAWSGHRSPARPGLREAALGHRQSLRLRLRPALLGHRRPSRPAALQDLAGAPWTGRRGTIELAAAWRRNDGWKTKRRSGLM